MVAGVGEHSTLKTYEWGEMVITHGDDDERRIKRAKLPGVSLIAWVNNPEMFDHMVGATINNIYQVADFELQIVAIYPEARCRNIGHAYNLGMQYANHRTKLYIHQDAQPTERSFLRKLHRLLDRPGVGGVGVVGSVKDTGAAFFHAPLREKRGYYYGNFYPEACRVALVDGFMFATREDIEWCEDYEGPHMAVEDMCMRIRERGKEIWTLDSQVSHVSGGDVGDAYLRSVEKFRANWAHVLPPDLPTAEQLARNGRAAKQYDLRMEVVRVMGPRKGTHPKRVKQKQEQG